MQDVDTIVVQPGTARIPALTPVTPATPATSETIRSAIQRTPFASQAPSTASQRSTGHGGQPRSARQKTLTVNRGAEACHRFWRDFENFPRFMAHLAFVEQVDTHRSHWVAHAPLGRQVEWTAELFC